VVGHGAAGASLTVRPKKLAGVRRGNTAAGEFDGFSAIECFLAIECGLLEACAMSGVVTAAGGSDGGEPKT